MSSLEMIFGLLLFQHYYAGVFGLSAGIESREEETISFDKLPNCAKTSCSPFYSSSIGCPTFTKSCFCSALQPLKCANKSCLGDDWYAVEDWYATVCPGDSPVVSFSAFALCGRDCVRGNIVPAWCNTTTVGTDSPTRNCFCRITEEGFMQPVFTACLDQSCDLNKTESESYLSDFWKDNCMSSTNGGAGNDIPGGGEVVQLQVPTTSDTASGSKKANIGMIVGCTIGGLTVISIVVLMFFCYRRRRWKQFDLDIPYPPRVSHYKPDMDVAPVPERVFAEPSFFISEYRQQDAIMSIDPPQYTPELVGVPFTNPSQHWIM